MTRATKYGAFDVHQATTVTSVMEEGGRVLARSILETHGPTIVEFLRGLRGAIHVPFEEGTQAQWLHDLVAPLVQRLDGFITAIALVPGQISPAIWYPIILGGLDDAETEQRVAAAERNGMLDLLVRHWRSVVRRLSRRERWEAACCADEIFHPDFSWALGFREGISCTREFWEDLAPMRDWEARVPAVKLLLEVDGQGESHLRRTIEEREALLRQMEREVTRLYRALRTAG